MEALLLTHPDVADVAVIGIPNKAAGELPRAFIVLKPNHKCNEKTIHDFVNGNITH